MTINHIYIIHREQDVERQGHLEDLIEKLKTISSAEPVIVEPEPIKEDVDELICMWSKAIWKRQGCISLYHTYMKVLERVVAHKQDGVLILEDDAAMVEWGELPTDKHLVFLYTRKWKDKQISNAANYFHNHRLTEELLSSMKAYYIKKQNRFRSLDIEFSNCKKYHNIEYGYLDYFVSTEFISTLGNDRYN